MTTSFTKYILPFVFCLWVFALSGQENVTVYGQPQFAINYSVSQSYSHNFSLTHRNFFVNRGDFEFRGRQLDLAHFSKFSLRENQSLALGIQYRFRDIFEDNPDELRLTQQFNFTYRPLTIRYGHRFRTEQRIIASSTIHRFRYRFALDFPLKGEKLDIGEPYFVGSLESLLSLTRGSSSEYDFRANGQFGWQLKKGVKLQLGVEYRLEDYSSVAPQHVFFLLTSAQLAL